MNICVVGWYYEPKLYKTLERVNEKYPVYVVAHRPNTISDLPTTLIPNVGLEFGCYDYYVKHIWDKQSPVLFMHDDAEIRIEESFDAIAEIPYDFSFIFESVTSMKADFEAHGRIFFASKKSLDELKGFWYDDKNTGRLRGIDPATGYDENQGIIKLKLRLKNSGLNVQPTICKWIWMGYRGKYGLESLWDETNNLIKVGNNELRGCFKGHPAV
jgi:hypothetical protein